MSFGKSKIYVLDIFGEISATPGSSLGGKATDMQKVIDFLHKAEIEGPEEVSGIIIRLNTPGGTTGTSEEVAMMIGKVRQAGIPVVASIADVCCSGGYWIASACDYIFANRTSMTGSIGVIMMLPNYKGLSEKVGVHYVTVKAGKMKDIGNPFRELSEEESEFLHQHAAETHKIFIDEVVKNRRLTPGGEDCTLFDGRPFSAEFAKENGMIDEIGTFYDALDYLLLRIGKNEEEVKIKTAVKSKGAIAKLFSGEISDIIMSAMQKFLAGGNQLIMR